MVRVIFIPASLLPIRPPSRKQNRLSRFVRPHSRSLQYLTNGYNLLSAPAASCKPFSTTIYKPFPAKTRESFSTKTCKIPSTAIYKPIPTTTCKNIFYHNSETLSRNNLQIIFYNNHKHFPTTTTNPLQQPPQTLSCSNYKPFPAAATNPFLRRLQNLSHNNNKRFPTTTINLLLQQDKKLRCMGPDTRPAKK